MAMVMPRARSSGALSISANDTYLLALFFMPSTLVIAAVKVVLPWSTCPMVPTFTCGLVRSKIFLAMCPGPSPLACARLRGDSCSDIPRYGLVVRELHRVRGAPLRHAAQVGRIAEHLGERHLGPHDLGLAARLHAFDLPAAAIQIAHHVTQELVRGRDLHLHHGLEELWIRFSQGGARRLRAGHLEGHLVGVDLVVRTIHR